MTSTSEKLKGITCRPDGVVCIAGDGDNKTMTEVIEEIIAMEKKIADLEYIVGDLRSCDSCRYAFVSAKDSPCNECDLDVDHKCRWEHGYTDHQAHADITMGVK